MSAVALTNQFKQLYIGSKLQNVEELMLVNTNRKRVYQALRYKDIKTHIAFIFAFVLSWNLSQDNGTAFYKFRSAF